MPTVIKKKFILYQNGSISIFSILLFIGIVSIIIVANLSGNNQLKFGKASTTASSSYKIYADELNSGWVNWSWDTKVNFQETSQLYSGTSSIAFSPTKTYGGLLLHTNTPLDTSPYLYLKFFAKAAGSNQKYVVYMYNENNQRFGKIVNLDLYGGNLNSESWTEYKIPLVDLGVQQTKISGLTIGDDSQSVQPTLFIDDIELTGQTINLVRNSGCESNIDGWVGWRSVISKTTASAHSGQASCLVTRALGSSYTIDDNPATVSKPKQNDKYTASAWVRSETALGKGVKLILRQIGGVKSPTITSSPTVSLNKDWQQLAVTTTVEAGRDSLEIYLAQDMATKGDSFFVDDISLAPDGLLPSPSQTSIPSLSSSKSTPTPTPLLPTPTPTTSPVSSGFSENSGRPFSTNSPFNMPIRSNPGLKSNSSAIARNLTSGPVADLQEFGVVIWAANSNTTKYNIDCTEPWGITEFGNRCPLETTQVSIPNGVYGAPGDDGAMVVVDLSGRRAYEFWRFMYGKSRPYSPPYSTSFGGFVSLEGDGIEAGAVSTGANISRLAGVVRTFEIEQGYIDHALVFSSSQTCANLFEYPAQKTDGHGSGDCIPEGARIQLDPGINFDGPEYSSMPKGHKIVARALQKYGAYNVDSGGASMAFVFEVDRTGRNVYISNGFSGDYDGMRSIPWGNIRVLNHWDGS